MKTYKFDHYYLYDEMTSCLKELAEDHPGLVKLSSICETDVYKRQFQHCGMIQPGVEQGFSLIIIYNIAFFVV